MGIAEIPLKEKCYQRPKGSIRELYRIGRGLPSSHTMVPGRAAEEFLKKQPSAPAYRVTLFDSLAATGKGHLTFQVLRGAFADRKVEIAAEPDVFLTLCWQSGTGSDLREAFQAFGEVSSDVCRFLLLRLKFVLSHPGSSIWRPAPD